jgi:pimeloyl-ACP methyl ester carboxylesterase
MQSPDRIQSVYRFMSKCNAFNLLQISLLEHMKKIIFLFILCLTVPCNAQTSKDNPVSIYLFPGQGSDFRIFQNLQFATPYEVKYITYPVPQKGTIMKQYAILLLSQIDTTKPFIIVGVSLGGMLCAEISDICSPEKTIIISSAAACSELPSRYTFMRYLPIYKLIPAGLLKAGAFIAQPIVEPDRRHGRSTFISMLRAKNPQFIKRSTEMIINWDRTKNNTSIVHIHGTYDHTLPIRKVHPDYIIKKGSHVMTYTRAGEISTLVNELIAGNVAKQKD